MNRLFKEGPRKELRKCGVCEWDGGTCPTGEALRGSGFGLSKPLGSGASGSGIHRVLSSVQGHVSLSSDVLPGYSTRPDPAWGTADRPAPHSAPPAYLPRAIASSQVPLCAVQGRSLSPAAALTAADPGADLKASRLQRLPDCGLHYHQEASVQRT
ncbi:unnamed protein product [Rangifer tarandus platyrhynchus]|uniref:Uncharacterized protein n=2 Tax=Rangifer tarandus platyrhynchus TaxID=3082113 RepID=A0ABN8ZC66_RANTA|nr:unnamed protein product [Rangifer tarandus platyrhynchus]CAI9706014.1 unnamed protein product [Rangifer tarandus platyrhynchus]